MASSSPRRKELLKDIFQNFETVSPKVEERFTYKRWGEIVKQLARLKAESVKDCYQGALIIAADTIVVSRGKMLGKPKDEIEAIEMLKDLSGSIHSVYSGVCIIYKDRRENFYDKAQVTFRKLSKEDIQNYVASEMPLDKAGAYGIQETDFAKKVKGSYSCVVGLPLEMLKEKLKKIAEESNG